jgi:acetyl-CoA C-acetyltransferase
MLFSRGFSTAANRSAVIVSYARTPIGRINGSLASKKGPELGAVAIRAAVERAGLKPEQVEEALVGNVVSGGMGQAPARQAAIYGGLPTSVCCTTINKVCASGMKTVMYAAQSIMLGQRDIVVAGGFESMTHVPHYMHAARGGVRLGHTQLVDGIIHDGLWDCYNNQHMGMCAEACAEKHDIGREAQDAYALQSYERSQNAMKNGVFKNEIVPVEVSGGRGKPTTMVTEDEEPNSLKLEKIATLRSAFKKDGTVTAANASTLNDGAAAFVVMSEAKANELGIKPLARIIGFADAEQDPVEFTTAPSLAVPKALENAGIKMEDVDIHEINEAFSVVALANMKLQGLDSSKVNIYGGAVSIGHPLGMSGARILGNVINALEREDKSIGMASICNGGGGASAVVLERCK